MKKMMLLGLAFLMTCCIVGIFPDESHAVPSFARQTGKSCSGCHTIWPRLNIIGRDFKEMGYTDVADDYSRLQLDTLDLLRYGPPISVSIISFPYSKQNAKGSESKSGETRIPDEVAFFFAGRITPNIGTFIEPHWERGTDNVTFELAKITGATRIGMNNTVGLSMLKSDVAGADPFNTIRFTAYHTVNTPAIFLPNGRPSGGDLFNFADTGNEGILAAGRFLDSMIYAAAGIFRGDGNATRVESDPLDFFYRLAFEYAFTPEMAASLGGFYYDGEQRYDHTGDIIAGPRYESEFNRYGADFQFQYESTPHNIDAIAVYMAGKDKDAWDPNTATQYDVKFKGFYGEVSYFYDRTYGVTVGYDYMISDEDSTLDKKGPTFNIAYLPWANTKFALEYSRFKLNDGQTEEDYNFLVHLYF